MAAPIVLVGPTASGKSDVALAVARRLGDVEIVSVDSMQVYRGMDIGTAKATPAERAEVPHHLIDVADPGDHFSVGAYQELARAALDDIERRGRRALLVGGTGLYVTAIVDALELPGRFPDVAAELETEGDTSVLHRRLAALDPVAAGRMEPSNRRRIVRALEVTIGSGRPFSSFGPGLEAYPPTRFELFALHVERPALDDRIAARYRRQIDAGFLDEVAALRDRSAGWSATAAQALGYKELLGHLDGTCTLAEAIDLAERRTRTFARRQQRWFRRDPRITWVPPVGAEAAILGCWS